MPVRAVRAGTDFVEIDVGGRTVRVSETAVASGSKDKMALAIKELLQEQLTTRTRLRDLPDDEEFREVEPPVATYGERMFWEGNGINSELVSRAVIVEDVTWDGERYVPTLRRAR